MWVQLAGWYGVGAILVAYALITFKVLTAETIIYLALNSTGALALIVQSYAIRNYQLIVLNVVWLLVACLGIAQALLQ
jgi:hypothetical protein